MSDPDNSHKSFTYFFCNTKYSFIVDIPGGVKGENLALKLQGPFEELLDSPNSTNISVIQVFLGNSNVSENSLVFNLFSFKKSYDKVGISVAGVISILYCSS